MKSEIQITGDRLQIIRVFDASRERVFAAWTPRSSAAMDRMQGDSEG
jgi:uncharacterized protein YndB with AHSA1/START domain